jgi:hypothetical protein
MESPPTTSYSTTSAPVVPAQPFVFRFAVGAPADVIAFKRAWDEDDQRTIGELLGYPGCCHEFFRTVWVEHAMVDTTWPMAVATAGPRANATTVEIAGPPTANILWRWMGVRAVPHLPCRADCQPTAELGKRLLAVGRAAGFAEEMDWTEEILSWPVQWSALHGIAEVTTPVLKVSTRTDATARAYVVRRPGDRYPEEGATGLAFPYRTPGHARVTGSRGFRAGQEEHPVQLRPSWYERDNGFTSARDMARAHAPIVELAARALSGRGGQVIDLGCGNGALLARLVSVDPEVVPWGIDVDPAVIEHARGLLPSFADHFVCGDVLEDDQPGPGRYDLAMITPGRLIEGAERSDHLTALLRTRCDQVLVYAYGDWLTRYGGLAPLAEAAGLHLVAPNDEHAVVALAVVDDQERTGALR